MTHTQMQQLSDLGQELLQLSQAMARIGSKLQHIAPQTKIKTVKVTPKTDPEMFTPEFIEAVRKSREDIKNGRVVDYLTFRKSLKLK